MKIKSLLLCLLFSCAAFAQGEANNWFFGQFGGIRFQSDGSVTPLAGGMMNTNEGCSTISDADGNLLFYTDGRNVWDTNHVLMPNGDYFGGTGLLGDPSSTQSGIIVPKKGDPNIYYIFTVDEPHHDNASVYPNQFTGFYSDTGETIPNADDGFNNGLNYSIVDLSVIGTNGSVGDVTTRNVHLLTYNPADNEEIKFKCSEKITAIRKGDGSGYWVIAHFIDKFYAFSVDENGVNETPVVTQIAPVVPLGGYRRNALGCIKASPDGDKLAIAHQQFGSIPGSAEPTGAVYVYDLDNMTGIVSAPVQLLNNLSPYGVEFSPQGKKLYVSYAEAPTTGIGFVEQFDLLSADIPASGIVLGTTGQPSTLQLGPNGKIYRAVISSQFLDVINNPEEDGALCNYVQQSQPINGISIFGLPPFITSFFSASMVVQNTCEGEATQFELNVNSTFDSVVWDFGDGTPTSTEEEPVHTYTTAGDYTATATVTRQGEITEISRDITIASVPVANIPPAITECDPDNDGVATFTLNDNNAAILGTQSSVQFDVRYYISQENADNNTSPLNGTSYTNTANPEIIYARIFNRNNNQCYATTSFQINVANTPVMLGNTFEICDENIDGDDTNGRAAFNLADVSAALVQDIAAYPTTFYITETDAQNQINPLPASFTNTVANEQVVYARVVNNASPECFAIEPITLIVNPLPADVPGAMLVQCDTGVAADGITSFNLLQANNLVSSENADYEVAYYINEADVAGGTPIGPTYTNISNPQTIVAKVTNTVTGCYRLIDLVLQVNTANTAPITLEECDQDGTEDGRTEFDLTQAGLEGTADNIVYYAFLQDALQEQNPISTDYTNIMVNLQSVYARLENNNNCVALQEIRLVVNPLPVIAAEAEATVCENTGDYVELTSGVNGNTTGYTFEWSTGADTRSIFVNEAGIYTVKVINANGCWRVRTITVEPSNIATIDDIQVIDLVDNNTITVYVHPTSNVNTTYLYSLDAPEGPYQESNYFEHVTPGFHTVYVYDENGCGVVEKEIAVLGIPKFFTPNGDGINDIWDIIGMDSEFYRNSEIVIFDRFGKVVGTVDPKGKGWDGTYNGRRLPATDYWYVVKLETGRVVTGHFSMIR